MTRVGQIGAERYGLALGLILASMVFMMAVPDGKWADLAAFSLQSLALLASTHAAQPDDRLRLTVTAVIGAVLLFAWVQAGFTPDVSESYVHLATFALVVIATPMIVWGLIRQVNENGRITMHTMMGVLCIYLLMSLAFSAAFAAIASINGEPFFTQGAKWDRADNYLYFSLTTITTAGLGDLSPAHSLGRSLTAAEALLGQVYVITVVAAIVANLRPGRSDG